MTDKDKEIMAICRALVKCDNEKQRLIQQLKRLISPEEIAPCAYNGAPAQSDGRQHLAVVSPAGGASRLLGAAISVRKLLSKGSARLSSDEIVAALKTYAPNEVIGAIRLLVARGEVVKTDGRYAISRMRPDRSANNGETVTGEQLRNPDTLLVLSTEGDTQAERRPPQDR